MDEVVLDRLASQADVIVHLAAAVGVKLIVEQPVHTLETNVMGAEAVLRAAQRYRAKVLMASTSEVYGKGVATPFREDDDVVLGPTCRNRWAYAASKMVDEFLSLAYYREKELPVVILRLFNTVGPRQTGRYGMVIPSFVQQALSGEPLSIHGDGQQSRCFCHVSDAVRAIMALAECPEAVGQVFNIGSTERVTIMELARRVLATVDELAGERDGRSLEERLRLIPYDQVYNADFEDMQRREPDIAKIQRYTGWAPRYTLQDILHDVVSEQIGRGELA
jgi:UDP-glucose 4-epimerase